MYYHITKTDKNGNTTNHDRKIDQYLDDIIDNLKPYEELRIKIIE